MATETTTEPPTISPTLQSPPRPYSYREAYIPAATAQCHASNLLLLPNGDLLCAWFGGSLEGRPDICIYLSRLLSGQTTWSPAEKMTHDHTRSEQNPILCFSPSKELWLLYTSQDAGNQDSAVVKHRVSTDNGRTWGDPRVLFPQAGTFVRQPPCLLDDGTWIIPTFKCRSEPGERWLGNDDISCVRVSKDSGKTWVETPVPNSYGCVHMETQRLRNGKYLAMYRSRWADNIYSSISEDGINFTEPTPISLPNPNAGICFDVLSSGRVVLVYNHSSLKDAQGRREGLYDDIGDTGDSRSNQGSKHGGKEAFWGAPRAPLNVAWSDDDGVTWTYKVLEGGDGYCMTNNSEKKLNRELSYPSMFMEDDTIHVAYTFWRQRIKYVRLGMDFFE